MSVTTIGSRSMRSVQMFSSLRSQLDDLQRQLGTGKKSNDYAGLGLDRGLTVALRSQLSALTGFDDTITQVGVRLDVAQSTLTRIAEIGSDTKSAAFNSLFDLNGNGQTADQVGAGYSLDELFALLNTQVGNRYLFGGRGTDSPATALPDVILNGDGLRAGFKQVMAERLQADLGVDGRGRLMTTSPGTTVSIAEDAANSPFGFKLTSVATTVSGTTVTAPAGSPPATSISFAGSSPVAGDTVTLRLALPDGTSETLTLTATTSAPPGANQFTIGATNGQTAGSLHAALNTALGTLADTSLRAASNMAAAQDFFDVDASRSPQRVAGPPFDTATALVDGSNANTVTWYTGDDAVDDARSTAVARVDPSMSVAYGMRATEQGLRSIVQAMAVFASATFSATDPNGAQAYAALQQRVGTVLAGAPGQQKVLDIAAELGGSQATIGAAQERHRQTSATLSGLLDSVEGVRLEEVGAQVLALQTNLQASMQTTALLSRTTILDFI